jgi:23S rRNA pseudouridine1911/1915/1917 synthase
MNRPLEILYEDNHCLAVAKPSGVVSAHFQGQEPTLDLLAKDYLKQKHHKPGRVFLGIVQRLDRPVSGVLLFARTSKAAARLAQQFRDGTVEKVYWAVIEGSLAFPAGTLRDYLKKDPERRRVEVVMPRTPGARDSELRYQVRAQDDGLSLLEIRPETGRTHQLRVQLGHRGHPIYGDAKYGSRHRFGNAIALHARSLEFAHPIRHERILLTADMPVSWRNEFASLFRQVPQ